MTQQDFTAEDYLRRMAKREFVLEEGDVENCGMSCHAFIWSEVAREMVENGDFENGISRWGEETKVRWEQTKFFKLWQEETAAGRDPNKAFAERGWEP